jgi:hypothetical protein
MRSGRPPLYLAGRVFHNPEWEQLGARVMHRFVTEEQTPDGYWGEHSDAGPRTGYNTLTLTGVALHWEHSRDAAALVENSNAPRAVLL